MRTMSAREFNRDVSVAKRRANDGPVAITDRGESAYVLMTIEEHRKRNRQENSLVECLSMDDDFGVGFGPVWLELKAPELWVTCQIST